jgi:tRNA A37 threonylcarbamoyladenosine modification protein TsaB
LPPDRLILAFDTSAAHCAAALLSGGQVLESVSEAMEKGQAERLIPMLEALLARHDVGWHDLAALGVGTGPGNFTGVRIGVAAARGLALGLNIPAIGVTRFEALAHGHERPLTVMIDARRDEVYVQSFTQGGPLPARISPADQPGEIIGRRLDLDASPAALTIAIARIAALRAGTRQPRPAPFYLRGAAAAPPSDAGPIILPEVLLR